MNNVQLKILEQCEEAAQLGELFDEKEEEFIESMLERSVDYELSFKQNKWLNALGNKVIRGY